MLCPWENARYLIFSSNVPTLLYYSHITAVVSALVLGFFVFLNNKKSSLSKALLLLVLPFSLYNILDLIIWATNKSYLVMFLWSTQILMEPFIFLSGLYVTYLFVGGRLLSLKNKLIITALLIPYILLIPTRYNLLGVRIATCDAIENITIIYYSYIVETIFLLWIILFCIRSYKKEPKIIKKRIKFFGFGIVLFLLAFSWGNIIGSITDDWVLAQYGLFGMPIFVGFLAYLIVRYQAFNIKLLSTQALVIALIILIGSLFLVRDMFTMRIITGITLALTVVAGWQLVRSVKLEVQQKEELQALADQLAIVNDKLRQLDKAKSEFISIASHQFRTPLTSIKGFGSLLLEGTYGSLSEPQRNALEKIYISNERLIHLVEDLLNVSRIEAGRMEFDFQEGQIEDLVQEVVDTLELSAKSKSLYLDWKKPEKSLPKIKIDIAKIKEVISNMVDNAIKYTPKGGVTVRVKLNKPQISNPESKTERGTIQVIVSDTGIGMEKEDLENIFNKFERGRGVSHYHTEGTGLGMYVGKKVVEVHKGRIWAESDGKGRGSRFILELPVDIA